MKIYGIKNQKLTSSTYDTKRVKKGGIQNQRKNLQFLKTFFPWENNKETNWQGTPLMPTYQTPGHDMVKGDTILFGLRKELETNFHIILPKHELKKREKFKGRFMPKCHLLIQLAKRINKTRAITFHLPLLKWSM